MTCCSHPVREAIITKMEHQRDSVQIGVFGKHRHNGPANGPHLALSRRLTRGMMTIDRGDPVTDPQARRQAPSRMVTACGVEHVRLSYYYMEHDDIDGYGSLLADDVVLDWPDTP